ncbi:MAG: hypothetical protein JSR64_09700 [Nitrospira sp.]|nr:hypothetical protein [Nitrospira sp.]
MNNRWKLLLVLAAAVCLGACATANVAPKCNGDFTRVNTPDKYPIRTTDQAKQP